MSRSLSFDFPFFASEKKPLCLAAGLHDDLNWSTKRKEAQALVDAGEELLGVVDLQIKRITPASSASLFAHMRALEEAAAFFSSFSTKALCVYNGPADLSAFFTYAEWEELFHEWLDELFQRAAPAHELHFQQRGGEWVHSTCGRHYYLLFCFHCFADYFERLVSVLPENAVPFVLFDMQGFSRATSAQLLSPERFTHLTAFAWQGEKLSLFPEKPLPSLALLLPTDAHCDRKTLADLDALIDSYRKDAMPFRLIAEDKLTQEWEGLDRLVVLRNAVSSQGLRKLQGFIAAGGDVLYHRGRMKNPVL